MNENLNLVEILKDCPEGTELYSIICGEVKLKEVDNIECSILLETITGFKFWVTQDGRYFSDFNGECTLFPSKNQRDWSKFKVKKPKFDPKTLKPFDKVLAFFDGIWNCDLYSHYSESQNTCVGVRVRRVIPYNDDTKHLLGTSEEAPEFYRYWED